MIEELDVYKRIASERNTVGGVDAAEGAILREHIAHVTDDRDSKTIQLNIAVADMNALKLLLSEEKEKCSKLGRR